MVKKYIPAIIMICIAFVSCKHEGAEETIQEYETMSIERQTLDIPESYSASIRGSQDVDIYPQVSGTITRVCVTEGQRVKRGETLFVIDRVPYQAALRTAKANVSAAKAKVETAKMDLESKKVLFDEQVISEYELSTARNALAMAQAELDQMSAQELDARNSLSYTEVKSPVNGVVGTLKYRTGSLVSPSMNEPLTTVSDNAVVYVYFSMNENRWRSLVREYDTAEDAIKHMPEVKLRLNDGEIYPLVGKIASVSGIVNDMTGSVSVRCEFPNEKGELLSGSIGNVILPDVQKDVIVIPQRTANELQDKVFVYAVEGRDNSHFVKAVEIKIDKMNDGKNYVVRSGLKEGDVIIANGVGLLRDGMEIKISERKGSEQ